MKRSNRSPCSILTCTAVLLGFLSGCADAVSPGTMIVHGKTTTFTSAYAYHHPALYDKDVTQTTILLSDKAVDVKKIKAAGGDFDHAVYAWLDDNKVAYWSAIFYPDGTYWSGKLYSPGELRYGGISCDLSMTRNDAQRVEGSCRTADEKEKASKEGTYIDVKFAVGF